MSKTLTLSLSLLVLVLFPGCDGDTKTPTPPKECLNVEGVATQDGLELTRPKTDATACQETGEEPNRSCTEVEPDLSCLGQSEPLGTSYPVTFRGCIVAFGLGTPTTANLTVTVFKETEGGSPVDPGYDTEGAAGMQTDNTPTARLGSVISTKDEMACADEGRFIVENVPTETPLIVRVTDQNEDRGDRLQVDTYQYNVILRNNAILNGAGAPVADPSSCTPQSCFADEEVNTISNATFKTIPRAAGVSVVKGEDDSYDNFGEGHVAGEVQDCTSNNKVKEAVVAVDKDKRKLTYFNVGFGTGFFDYEDPKPQSARQGTNADGLYAAIGVSAQPGGAQLTVGAIVTPTVCGPDDVCRCTDDKKENPDWTEADEGEGQSIVLATRTIYLFPDSVTILTFDRNLYTAP